MTDEVANQKPASWQKMKLTILDNSQQLPSSASEEAIGAEKNSQANLLRKAFLECAISRCKLHNLVPDSHEAWDILEEANRLADDLISPATYSLPFNMDKRAELNPSDIQDIFSITSRADQNNLFIKAAEGEQLHIDIKEFEIAVGSYLRSDYRLPQADRLIVTALLDAEITAYLKQIMEKDFLTRKSPFATFGGGQHLIWIWVKGRLRALAFFAVWIAAVFALLTYEIISDQTALYFILGIVALAILGFVVTLVGTLRNIPEWRKLRPKIVDLPKEMAQLYGEVHAPGPLGIKRIRSQAQKLADIGAVWPSSFWAIVEDIESRGVVTLDG